MQINQLQTFANSDSGAASNPHVWTTLYWMTGRRWDCNMRMRCHCNMRRIPFGAIETASNTDSMILTALLLQQRRWDRPLGTVHFATVKCQLIQQFCDHPSHKMRNSISEMNSAFQFALARSSGHSEGCHHVKLLQPRVNAVRLILHSGMPNDDKLVFTKFQFQLLLSNFAFGSHALNMANLFVLEKTQTPSFVMLSFKS